MCDVHLVEQCRTVRDLAGFRCGYCEQPIAGAGVLVEGTLDDGTPGLLAFAYHEACAIDMAFDVGEDGCFSYGTPLIETVGHRSDPSP